MKSARYITGLEFIELVFLPGDKSALANVVQVIPKLAIVRVERRRGVVLPSHLFVALNSQQPDRRG